jgi:hypothetical protein
MIIRLSKLAISFAFGVLTLSACTTAKLEARLEANPQCKDVINTKTGALMPCRESDKAFYRSVGLEAPKPIPTNPAQAEPVSSSTSGVVGAAVAVGNTELPKTNQAPISQDATRPKIDCKPTIHNKTGGLMPVSYTHLRAHETG